MPATCSLLTSAACWTSFAAGAAGDWSAIRWVRWWCGGGGAREDSELMQKEVIVRSFNVSCAAVVICIILSGA